MESDFTSSLTTLDKTYTCCYSFKDFAKTELPRHNFKGAGWPGLAWRVLSSLGVKASYSEKLVLTFVT